MFKHLIKKQRVLKRLEANYNLQEEYEKICQKNSSLSKYERDLLISLFEMEVPQGLMEAFEKRNLKTNEDINKEIT